MMMMMMVKVVVMMMMMMMMMMIVCISFCGCSNELVDIYESSSVLGGRLCTCGCPRLNIEALHSQ
jgi:hypothetical protein